MRTDNTKYTDEQQAIIDSPIGESKKVLAFAGTGKTQTLSELARKNIDKRLLYIVYNKKMATDAEERMPEKKMVKTSHSFARSLLSAEENGKFHEDADKAFSPETRRLTNSRNDRRNAKILGVIRRFCTSDDTKITSNHLPKNLRGARDPAKLPSPALGQKDARKEQERIKLKRLADMKERRMLLSEARRAFKRMRNPNDSEAKFHHEHYLKITMLDGRFVDELDGYAAILLDEAQDTNPALAGAMRKTSAPITAVGDQWQAIYSFRGARDYLSEAKGKTYHLTHSFRYGDGPAEIATELLYTFMGETRGIVGRGPATQILPSSDKRLDREEHLILARTNVGVVKEAIQAHKNGTPYRMLKEVSWETLKIIHSVAALLNGERMNPKVHAANICEYEGKVDEFRGNVEEHGDAETRLACALWVNYRESTSKVVAAAIDNQEESEEKARILISTVHGAKGLEYDAVALSDDFSRFGKLVADGALDLVAKKNLDNIQEINLVYVAVTRAKKKLRLNREIEIFLNGQ